MIGSQHGDNSHHDHHHQCHFPVSKKESPKDQKSHRYIRVPVFSDDESQEKGQRARLKETQGGILLSAWAVLLHKYTGSELVSFATFFRLESLEERRTIDALAPEEHHSDSRNGSGRCDGSILRYQFSEHTRLQDVRQVSREPSTAGDVPRGGTVNTAIGFSGLLDHVGCGLQNGENREDMEESSLSVHSKTPHWSENDYVGSFHLTVPFNPDLVSVSTPNTFRCRPDSEYPILNA